jgi:hypothetical protein
MEQDNILDIKVGTILYVVTPNKKCFINVKECVVENIEYHATFIHIFSKTKHNSRIMLYIDNTKLCGNLSEGIKTTYICEGYSQQVFSDKNKAKQYAIELVDQKIAKLQALKEIIKNESHFN